jgi:3-hydroxyisobutyrate dehydrogenase-like beta-hydroxyacid dehydrogenase
MAKLGFLGLGLMGYPMARNLLDAGHEVALWSHTASKAKKLAKAKKGGGERQELSLYRTRSCVFVFPDVSV